MSRRFSDAPVNFIYSIPSPEQISSARLSKRLFGYTLVEIRTACARSVAKILPHLRRWRRIVHTAVSGRTALSGFSPRQITEQAGGNMRNHTTRYFRSYDRLAKWIGNQDLTELSVRPATFPAFEILDKSPPKVSAAVSSIQQEEFVELRTYALNQQEEFSRLSAQVKTIQSVLVSQHQLLVSFGKGLESNQIQVPTMTPVASAPAKRNRVAPKKSRVKKKGIHYKKIKKIVQKPSQNLCWV